MKPVIVGLCIVLAVASCGAGPKQPKPKSDLDGVRGFLKSAFSSSKTIEGGGLCGDPMLVGDVVGSVPGRISGCGIENAVRLRAIGDVTLSQPATIDCNTAKALKTWVEDAAMPATKRLGDISGLRVAAHYACRTRNNRPGAKISEHGRGKAIDIAAVQFTDGTELSVLRDWGTGKRGKALREMHGEACGTFGTVLGPGSDGYHKDHFHFDTARHGNGAYCRPR